MVGVCEDQPINPRPSVLQCFSLSSSLSLGNNHQRPSVVQHFHSAVHVGLSLSLYQQWTQALCYKACFHLAAYVGISMSDSYHNPVYYSISLSSSGRSLMTDTTGPLYYSTFIKQLM